VARSIMSQNVILVLSRLMRLYGKPAFIPSDQGTELTAGAVMRWLRDRRVGPAFIPPGPTPAQRIRGEPQRKAGGRMLEPGVVSGPA
jgi:hypothetical protein